MTFTLRLERGRWRFAPGLGLTLAVLAALAVLVGLGTWQLQRLAWKEALIAERAAQLQAAPAPLPASAADWRAYEFRRVEASGVFRHDLEQLFGVSTHEGVLGHHVLTPLVRSDGSVLLVDRGWVPRDRTDPATRTAGQPGGQVTVAGIARYRGDDAPGWLTPENRPDQRLWYHYDLAALAAAVGLDLLPVVLEADASPNPGGLPTGGLTRIELPNPHLQYAVTWYGLAVVLAAMYVSFGLRPREPRQ